MFKIPTGLEAKLKWNSQWTDIDAVWIKVEFCASLMIPDDSNSLYHLSETVEMRAEIKARS